MFTKEEKQGKKYRIIGFFVASSFPIAAIIISVVLVKKGINLNDYIFKSSSNSNDSGQLLGENTQGVAKEVSVFKANLEPILSNPEELRIKSINLKVPLTSVGVKEDGTMETPNGWDLAGWFKQSASPGESRNLVINGHYDSNTGAKAAFYYLKNVKQGDLVEVIDEYGRIFSYKVLELDYVDIDDPTRLEVLNDEQGKSTLTLITCGGVWTSSGYNKRLIVKAELERKTESS